MASNTMWNGVKQFSIEFNANDITTLDDLADAHAPQESVLVTIPYLEYDNGDLARIKTFIDNGGTVLLMDDYGYGNSLLAYLGVSARFTNRPLLDPLFNYKNQAIPRITDFAPDVKKTGIDVMMLNHASTLVNVSEAEAIAWSSVTSFLDENENESWDQGEPKGPFAVAAEFRLGKGTLVTVSDPSIVINVMVGQDDNYAFIRYLTGHNATSMTMLIDSSHLTKTPLDASKKRLINGREILSTPYALLGITAMIFVVVTRYTLKKGDSSG
jgi:hypothetical protein